MDELDGLGLNHFLDRISCTPNRHDVALDGMGPEQALAFVDALPPLRWVKVGLELFVAGGPGLVQQLRARMK